jgi:hypothetical protein
MADIVWAEAEAIAPAAIIPCGSGIRAHKQSALRRLIEVEQIERLPSKQRDKAIAPYGPGNFSFPQNVRSLGAKLAMPNP